MAQRRHRLARRTTDPTPAQPAQPRLGVGDRRPCPGCDREKYEDDYDLDHVVPRSKGGLDADENLQLLCSSCNRSKGGRLTMPELRKHHHLV